VKEQADKMLTLQRRALFVLVSLIGLLGGNLATDKHRMVPPFFIL